MLIFYCYIWMCQKGSQFTAHNGCTRHLIWIAGEGLGTKSRVLHSRHGVATKMDSAV